MISSRRQFVASLSAVPFLAQSAGAQSRAQSANGDPVLDQLVDDLRDLAAEFQSQPSSRKATLRALESTLSVGAAHLAANYDRPIQNALRRRQARIGRAAVTQEVVDRAHRTNRSEVTHEIVETAIARFEKHGASGCFQDVQETVRKIRLHAPEQVQAVAFARAQFDYCADLNWEIEMLEGMVQIVCSIAILEPTPGGEAVCGALGLLLGILMTARAWFC